MTRWVLVGTPGLFLGSTPTPCEPLFDSTVDGARRVNCRRYGNCLVHAIEQGWDSFTCADCPIDESITKDQWQDDLEGLAGVLRAMFG